MSVHFHWLIRALGCEVNKGNIHIFLIIMWMPRPKRQRQNWREREGEIEAAWASHRAILRRINRPLITRPLDVMPEHQFSCSWQNQRWLQKIRVSTLSTHSGTMSNCHIEWSLSPSFSTSCMYSHWLGECKHQFLQHKLYFMTPITSRVARSFSFI